MLELTVAVIVLGYALEISNGHMNGAALALVTVAIGICFLGVWNRSRRLFSDRASLIYSIAGLGLAFQLWNLFRNPPGIYLVLPNPNLYFIFLGGIVLAAGIVALSTRNVRPQIWLPLLAAIHFLLGVWMIEMSPDPRIDVFYEQREACKALLHGQDPYTTTYPDTYAAPRGTPPTALPTSSGLGYPPVSYLLALPGYIVGDIRYAHLAAMFFSALLIGFSASSQATAMIAAVFLFTPRTFFVLEQSWTEPFIVLLLAATVFCKVRRYERLVPVFLGLLLASKQHLFLIVPAVALLIGSPFHWKDYAKLLAKSALIALAVTAPFSLWNPAAFWRVMSKFSTVGPRTDSLSYAAWSYLNSGPYIAPAVAFLLAFGALAFCIWRLPRTPAGFAAATAVFYLVLIAFSNTAFCNYYYMVIGFLSVSVAAPNRVAHHRKSGI